MWFQLLKVEIIVQLFIFFSWLWPSLGFSAVKTGLGYMMQDLNVGIHPDYCLLLVNFVLLGSLSVWRLSGVSICLHNPGSWLGLFPLELPSCRSNGGQQTSMSQMSHWELNSINLLTNRTKPVHLEEISSCMLGVYGHNYDQSSLFIISLIFIS